MGGPFCSLCPQVHRSAERAHAASATNAKRRIATAHGPPRGVAAANNRQVNNMVNQVEKNYQNELKRIDKDLANLDADREHINYRDVLFARLLPKQHAE